MNISQRIVLFPATLPGMWERTITIGSAGKTFSVTGWKLGWSIGPKNLIHALQTVHQNCVYTCPTPLQVNTKHFTKVYISGVFNQKLEPYIFIHV